MSNFIIRSTDSTGKMVWFQKMIGHIIVTTYHQDEAQQFESIESANTHIAAKFRTFGRRYFVEEAISEV